MWRQPFHLDSFQDPCDLLSKLTHFKTLYVVYSTKLFELTPFKTPALSMGNYLQIDSVKPPWETSFNKIGYFKTIPYSESWTHFKTLASFLQCFNSPWETSLEKVHSFRTILHSRFWIPFKTPVTDMLHSVNGLISRPFGKGKEDRTLSSTVLVAYWTPFKTPMEIKDRGHRTTGQIVHHHHCTIERM